MRCAVIDAEKANYPIAWMCRQLGVPRSSFYAWRHQVDTTTATAARRRVLGELVVEVFDDNRGTYGCRRVAAELNRRGHPVSVGLVADLMRELGLQACQQLGAGAAGPGADLDEPHGSVRILGELLPDIRLGTVRHDAVKIIGAGVVLI